MPGKNLIPGAGRKQKTASLKKLAGNPGKRELNEDPPDTQYITAVEPPAWLGKLATKMWETVAPLLCKQKILIASDLHNLEGFCIAYQEFRLAAEAVETYGILIKTAKGALEKNPALTAEQESSRRMVMFGSLLGLDPVNRQRVVGLSGGGQKDNPFHTLDLFEGAA